MGVIPWVILRIDFSSAAEAAERWTDLASAFNEQVEVPKGGALNDTR